MRNRKFKFAIFLFVAPLILSFQNCSSTLQPAETGLRSNLSSPVQSRIVASDEAAAYYLRAMDQKGNGLTPAFTGQNGVYYWGVLPAAIPVGTGTQPEKATKLIADSGFSAIRIALGADSLSYGFSFPAAEKPTSLKGWLQVPEMQSLLVNPTFPLVAVTATDLSSEGAILKLSRLKDPNFRTTLFHEYLDFFTALYELPVLTKKTFVVSNWEGDNQIFKQCTGGLSMGKKVQDIQDCSDEIFENTGQNLNDSIDAFIMWNLVRKSALIAAKETANINSNIDIRFGIEFNQLHLVDPNLSRSVFWDVVPAVKPDVVLYSSYEGVTHGTLPKDISEVRKALDEWGLNNTVIGIGEIGRIGTVLEQQQALKKNLSDVGLSDVAFAFVWNAFNESKTDNGTSYSMGLWMPNGELHVAPTHGLLVPKLNAIANVSNGCFSNYSPTCELTISGVFPDYALNAQSAEIRCDGGGIIPLLARYVTPNLAAVSLPGSLRGQSCALRYRSDIGLASAWSNSFSVGLMMPPGVISNFNISASGYDIVLIGGQSNSSNGGMGSRVDSLEGQYDDRIFQLNCVDTNQDKMLSPGEESRVINATDHVHDCIFDNPQFVNDIIPFKRIGFGVSFARQYAKYTLAAGRKVLLVAGGVSGSGSDQWSAGSGYLESLLTRTQKALALPGGQNRVVALLWSQGEGDIMPLSKAITSHARTRTNSSSDITAFAENLVGIVDSVRGRINDPRLPILISEKAPNWAQFQIEKIRYQDADRWVSQKIGDSLMIPANHLASNAPGDCQVHADTCMDETVHFSAQSNIDLGIRFHSAYRFLRP